jgi:hypothetical protein
MTKIFNLTENEFIKNVVDVRQRSWISSIYNYMIDWNTRESARVSTFMRLEFTAERQLILEKIVKENGWDKIKDNDIKVIKILQWVRANLTYVSDRIQYKTSEKWAFVDDILQQWYVWKDNTKRELVLVHYGLDKPDVAGAFRCDDCEGGATLIWALCVVAGVPRNQIYMFAGDVVAGQKTEGHAWVGYISAKYPYVFFFLDWCYWYSGIKIANRKAYLMKDKNILGDNKYKRLWFFSNDETTYVAKR